MSKRIFLFWIALLMMFLGCRILPDPLQQRLQKMDGFPSDAILVSDLYAHPKKYKKMVGTTVTVVGYLDFFNVLDNREAVYPEETFALIARADKSGTEPRLFVHFKNGTDPHPLFDEFHGKANQFEAQGLIVIVKGNLQFFRKNYNFNSDIGFLLNEVNLDDVTILK